MITSLEPVSPSEVAPATERPAAFSLAPRTLAEALDFAKLVADSDLAPKDYRNKAGNVIIAVQMGAELGLAPMQALQNISVINGRPAVWGDAMLALVQQSGLMEWIEETDDGDEATCRVQRRGYPTPTVATFSDDDAKAAGLLGKPGPWQQYRPRMRKLRARAFALRDAFADVLRGLCSAEEVSADADRQALPPRPAIAMPRAVGEVIEAVATPDDPTHPVEIEIRGKVYRTAGICKGSLLRVWALNGRAKEWMSGHGIGSSLDLTEDMALALFGDVDPGIVEVEK